MNRYAITLCAMAIPVLVGVAGPAGAHVPPSPGAAAGPAERKADMLNALLDAIYRNAPNGKIKASSTAELVLERDGYPGITRTELKETLESQRIVFTLKNADGTAPKLVDVRAVAEAIATALDRDDGKEDGVVHFSTRFDVFDDTAAAFGEGKTSVTKAELADKLVAGELVISRTIRPLASASNENLPIIELHENDNGLVFTRRS